MTTADGAIPWPTWGFRWKEVRLDDLPLSRGVTTPTDSSELVRDFESLPLAKE